jgi:hypothetical protein
MRRLAFLSLALAFSLSTAVVACSDDEGTPDGGGLPADASGGAADAAGGTPDAAGGTPDAGTGGDAAVLGN